MFNQPKIHSEKQALDIFIEESNKRKPGVEGYNYSNINGEFFFHEPMKVLGMIPGTYEIFNKQPCVYVITESDNTWYVQALEIVRDTIKYVLSRDNREQYYLHWSG